MFPLVMYTWTLVDAINLPTDHLEGWFQRNEPAAQSRNFDHLLLLTNRKKYCLEKALANLVMLSFG